jgi:apolipoprotein N-acyltransferase
VRVTNSGVTGVFDNTGREILRLPTHTAAARSLSVPIRSAGSFYSRHGDLFALACIVVSVAALGACAMGVFPQ